MKGSFSRKMAGHGVDLVYESDHCLYRGGARNKLKANFSNEAQSIVWQTLRNENIREYWIEYLCPKT